MSFVLFLFLLFLLLIILAEIYYDGCDSNILYILKIYSYFSNNNIPFIYTNDKRGKIIKEKQR